VQRLGSIDIVTNVMEDPERISCMTLHMAVSSHCCVCVSTLVPDATRMMPMTHLPFPVSQGANLIVLPVVMHIAQAHSRPPNSQLRRVTAYHYFECVIPST
jgi:hypothetical protein